MSWSCAAVRRRLPEYHDGELTIDEQVAIHGHLRVCEFCAAEARGLDAVGWALRASAMERAQALDTRQLNGLAAGVVSRMKAERDESLSCTIERMFEDLHLVWAALGATAATLACLAITVGVFYFSKVERPDSLAALIDALSHSGSNAYPVKMDASIDVPRQDEMSAAPVPEVTADNVWAVNVSITREGRVADLQLISDAAEGQPNWNTVGKVLDAAARAKFEPARSGGAPVAVRDMVWLIAHLTVRPKAPGEVRAVPLHASTRSSVV
jgi:hypothetical protein